MIEQSPTIDGLLGSRETPNAKRRLPITYTDHPGEEEGLLLDFLSKQLHELI
jgi:hypothetical protein